VSAHQQPEDVDFGRHMADPQAREREFVRRCAAQDIDATVFRRDWEAGRIDPDAGYDPASPYFGKDVAALGMLLEVPRMQHARRA
jgi:hypothetical protein